MNAQRLLCLAPALFFCAVTLHAQPMPEGRAPRQERQLFSADVLSYPSDSAGSSAVELFFEIPYEGLQFVKTGEFFRATFDISVGIYSTGNVLISEKLWREQLDVASIGEIRTLKPGEILQKTILIPPGRYFFNVRLEDRETRRASTQRLEVTVTDFSRLNWALSDIMLVKSYEVIEGRRVITPNIPGTISDATDSFYVFFKLINGAGVDSATLTMDLLDRNRVVARSETLSVGVAPGENILIQPVRCSLLPLGSYTLTVHAFTPSDTVKAVAERGFSIQWVGSPVAVEDLDRAIDQMQYILERERLEEMRRLEGAEKRAAWLAYWKKKDPSPGTDRNELMEEYYIRVDYANKHFGHYTEGWKTDMGMVYIIFGMPSNIERHPFEIDSKPYEIWTYYEMNREFLFVDATGFGDYRLQTPIWDVYQTRPR